MSYSIFLKDKDKLFKIYTLYSPYINCFLKFNSCIYAREWIELYSGFLNLNNYYIEIVENPP